MRFLPLILLLFSCAQVKSGKYVKLISLNDLGNIAKSNGLSIEEIKSYNPDIRPGDLVFIPLRRGVLESARGDRAISAQKTPRISETSFLWPLKGHRRISSHYGRRRRRMHSGVDISAPRGTQIIAAKSGVVLFSGWMRGYGKVTIIKHDDIYHTVYAHASRNLKRKGQRVIQGEPIARVGSTGRSTGNHLHFEIRIKDKPTNPLDFYTQSLAFSR